eukprot:TRINITY_DN3069_c0_g1_i2.p1 TRINITY_DN3069_c0_g1~~TRINITY_DN3069_c0_g1_i2.p1  ORF type:complete len:203 (+),score=40.48 TRINITY_DN3069_c0_g1_i2:131-739(+)
MTSNSENSQLSSNLSRQQAEVVILRSIYGGEGEFELSPDENAILEILSNLEVAFNASNRKRDSSKNSIEATSSTCQSFCIKHVLIWFHHIKSLEKRKSILGWAKALNLGGYCKPGFPGIIVVEGEKRDVDVYVKQLQSLRWQAMSVREEQEEEVLIESEVNNKRCFLNGMKELDENGMSDLGRLCREANLENLFLSALKINR